MTYLWHPRTQGALYIYDTFVAPFLAKHEPDIDRRIDETRASVGDVVVRNSRGAVDFVRNKMTNLLLSVPQANGDGRGSEARYMGARNATEAAATAYTKSLRNLGPLIDGIGENHFFIGKITNVVSNFIGFALKSLSNVSRVNVNLTAAACEGLACQPKRERALSFGRPTRPLGVPCGRADRVLAP